jgi:hypothetical protein
LFIQTTFFCRIFLSGIKSCCSVCVFIIHISRANGKDWCICHIKEVRGYWRKLHNEERLDLCCPTDIVMAIKFRRARWTHTHTHTHTPERTEMDTEFWWRNANVIDVCDDLGFHETVILKLI